MVEKNMRSYLVFFNYKVEGKIGSKKYEKIPSILVKNVLSHTIIRNLENILSFYFIRISSKPI
jgi:hypothetical protein